MCKDDICTACIRYICLTANSIYAPIGRIRYICNADIESRGVATLSHGIYPDNVTAPLIREPESGYVALQSITEKVITVYRQLKNCQKIGTLLPEIPKSIGDMTVGMEEINFSLEDFSANVDWLVEI